MKKYFLGCCLAFLLGDNPTMAADCSVFYRDIDDIAKSLSAIDAADFLDNSAPRATMRYAQATALYGRAEVLLTQMAQLKCPSPPYPIGPSDYLSDATGCDLAKREDKLEEAKKRCDRDTWRKFRKGHYVD